MEKPFAGRLDLLELLILLLLLGILPFFVSTFGLILGTEILIMSIFALSFNLLFGYTGLLSFGQAAFFGIGAYASGLLIKELSISIYGAVIGGILCSLLVSLIIGYLSVRLQKIGFAMLTLAFSQMIYTIIYKWKSLTGGDDGLIGIPKPILKFFFGLSVDLSIVRNYYFFVLVIFALSFFVMRRIIDSPFGLNLQSIRANDLRAEFIGINVKKYQLYIFMIAAIFSGLAGAVHSVFTSMASPEVAHWSKSAEPLLMTLLGGTEVFIGPVIGVAIFILLKHFITYFTPYWMIYLGAILVFLVLFFPGGIGGYFKSRFIDRV